MHATIYEYRVSWTKGNNKDVALDLVGMKKLILNDPIFNDSAIQFNLSFFSMYN